MNKFVNILRKMQTSLYNVLCLKVRNGGPIIIGIPKQLSFLPLKISQDVIIEHHNFLLKVYPLLSKDKR